MSIYYILLIYFIVIALLNDRLTIKSRKQILFLSGTILIIFAGLRGIGVDNDYQAYVNFFDQTPKINHLFTNSSTSFLKLKIEPTMILMISAVKSISSNGIPLIIFLYALFSVTLKLKAITKITDYILPSVLIYFSTTFLLHDMTQIRAGLAAGFLLLSIPEILQKNATKYYMYIFIAVLFHYSAIVFAPFYFFNTKKINKTIYVLLLVTPIILSILHYQPINLLLNFDLGIYSTKIKNYVIGQSWLKFKINLFNFAILSQILISVFFIFFCEKTKNKYTVILTKINCFGIVFFYLLSDIPVLAFRISEIFGIVQIILIPFIIYIIKPKALSEAIVILFSIAFFLNQIILNPILKPYTFIFLQ